MAIVNSITMGKSRGSLGNVTLRVTKDGTVASQKIEKKTQLIGTRKQTVQRVKMANIVKAFRNLQSIDNGGFKVSFETKKPNESDYNAFVAANMAIHDVNVVVQTKQEAATDILFPAPFKVTEGTLAAPTALQATFSNGVYTLPGLTSVTNMGDVFELLVNTYGCKQGDILTFLTIGWDSNHANVSAFKWEIDTASTATLDSHIDKTAKTIKNLSSLANCESVVIRGRNEVDGFKVSPAQFGDGMTTMAPYTIHTDVVALEDALDSYGYRDNPYLQSNP